MRGLLEIDETLTADNIMPAWHDLLQIKEPVQTMFGLGLLDLESSKARMESLYWQIAKRLQMIAPASLLIPARHC